MKGRQIRETANNRLITFISMKDRRGTMRERKLSKETWNKKQEVIKKLDR